MKQTGQSMKEYEFRGGVIEYLVNMLHNVWYIRLDRLLSSIRNVIVKATKWHIPKGFGKITR